MLLNKLGRNFGLEVWAGLLDQNLFWIEIGPKFGDGISERKFGLEFWEVKELLGPWPWAGCLGRIFILGQKLGPEIWARVEHRNFGPDFWTGHNKR